MKEEDRKFEKISDKPSQFYQTASKNSFKFCNSNFAQILSQVYLLGFLNSYVVHNKPFKITKIHPFQEVSHAALCSRECGPPCLALSTNFPFPTPFTLVGFSHSTQ